MPSTAGGSSSAWIWLHSSGLKTEHDEARDAKREQTGDKAWDNAFFPELVEYWDEIRGEARGKAKHAEQYKP